MYINDINIMFYVIVGIIGLFVGQFIDWCNNRLPEYKKVFSKEFFTIYLKNVKPKYFLAVCTSIIYIALLYFIGWQENILYKIELIKYMLLTPMLISAFIIDYKLQIIPNRLNLTIFELGLITTFIEGIYSPDLAISNLIGGLVGAGIFLAITLIGGILAGKEAMGFGDVKFMGALGLFFGWMNIIGISVIAFLLAAIISIILIITKIRKTDEYIPFGPFIVIASIIVMLVPQDILLFILFKIFTLGMYQG
ncbi:MAG: hypothetical protein HFJ41_06735 [Clostridia bacterium]|nr:hypothetical protein [Clostridia bacterium]